MNPTVLLVEDEPLLNMAVCAALEDGGYDVVSCCSGREALSWMAKHKTKFHCLVTDIRLGEGPTGWDIGRKVNEISKDIAIIYMSGDSYADWDQQGVKHSLMLAKPMPFEQLLSAIAAVVMSKKPEPT